MQDISILNQDWLLIGRQVQMSYDKSIDLYGDEHQSGMIDPDGNQRVAVTKAQKELWNGKFFASFNSNYPWEDARRLSFIRSGGAA
jgi:hypothetical protein